MESVYLNSLQRVILDEALRRESEKRKRHFGRKRLSHYRNQKLRELFESLTVDFSDVLYEIPFKCYFSFYLYLILKSRIKYLDWLGEMPYYFRIAVSQDLNIMKISREFGICRNIVRKAYDELIRYKLIENTPEIKPIHKSCKSVLVYNDYYIHSFDKDLGHVVFSSEIPFNYYNK